MNQARGATRRSLFLYLLGLACSLSGGLGLPLRAAGPPRIWVDASGRFSVEAELVEVLEQRIVLLGKNGKRLTIAIDKLSQRDQEYLDRLKPSSIRNDNLLRLAPPRTPAVAPLPPLDLPPTTTAAPDGEPLSSDGGTIVTRSSRYPQPLKPDAPPWRCGASPTRIPLRSVDISDHCSRPIPIITSGDRGTRTTSVILSVSEHSRFATTGLRNQLIRFDAGAKTARVALSHDQSIQLLDHHLASGRSLVLTGFNSLGQGGGLAIATGWEQDRVRLSLHRPLAQADADRLPHLRWAGGSMTNTSSP